MKNIYRTRNYAFVFYEDDPSHVKAMEHIKLNYEYIYILHDLDISDKTGELKKPHYHYIVRFDNPRIISGVSDELELDERHIQEVRHLKGAMLYLVHKNDPTKIQYNVNDLVGTNIMLEYFDRFNSDSKSESERIMEIITFIDLYQGKISTRDVLMFAINHGYYSEFRRSYSIIKDIIHLTNYNNSL